MSDFATCCVLSYERPEFLHRSLTSLKENAGEEFQLIIHDDGTQTEGIDDVLNWARVDLGATIMRNPPGYNEGQGIALNRMFYAAQGDPIIKLDQDLDYSVNWLVTTRNLVNTYPNIGLLGLFKYWLDPVDWRQTMIEDYGDHESHTHICGSGFALTRTAWNHLHPFAERSAAFAEDWDMQKRVTDYMNFYCALPKEDLVGNFGFGIGPSTIVVAEGQVREIKHTSRLVTP